MAKIVALAAYFYQAVVAFGLLIAVAHLLAPADYAAYSLFISLSQFGAILCFEWVRFACSRFYPGQAGQEPAERRALMVEFSVCAAICMIASLVAIAFGVSLEIALFGGLVAIFQGGSELHLTMLRFRQEFRSFSRLQGSRATILALGTLAGGAVSQSFGFVAAGLLCGYIAYSLLAFALTHHASRQRADIDFGIVRKHLTYGSAAAGASVVSMLAPLGLKSILTASLGAGGAAGALLALDLLQRPFVLIVSALQAIQYPDVVSRYDSEGESPAVQKLLGDYYSLLTGFTLMTAAGIFALLQPVGRFVVAGDLQQGFLAAAPFVTAMSVARALTQNMLPTPAHLRRRLVTIFMLALIDCVLLNLGTFAAGWVDGSSGSTLLCGSMLGALVATVIGVGVLVSLPFDFVWPPVIFAGIGLAVPVLATAGFGQDLWAFVGVGIFGGGLFCLLGLYSYFNRMYRFAAKS